MKARALLLGTLLSALAAFTTFAENTATNPVPRNARWMRRHDGFVEQAKQGGINLLFLGDSITDFWRNRGSNVWARFYAPRHAANFGISGDRTQHLLWRMEHGELAGIKPQVVVLMIGTNNTGKERDGRTIRNTPDEVVQGVTAVVHELHARLPESKILFLAIFPRGQKGDPIRDEITGINARLEKLADGKTIVFLDIGRKFLEPDGTLSRNIMPDLLHPSLKGYEIWAQAMEPTLEKMLQ